MARAWWRWRQLGRWARLVCVYTSLVGKRPKGAAVANLVNPGRLGVSGAGTAC
jgi:hypothetical protein